MDPTQHVTPDVLQEAIAVVAGEPSWIKLFWFCAYAMAAGCIFGAVRRGLQARGSNGSPSPVWGVLTQLAVFVMFGVLLWLLESLAHSRAPYYVYAPEFRDGLPRWTQFPEWIGPLPPPNACINLVRDLQNRPGTGNIPLCVILLEASLAYSAMQTARLLGGSFWSRALLAGLILVNVDILLDPVVAQSHGCALGQVGRVLSGADQSGLGFWHWFIPTQAELDKQHLLATWWFDIPVYNYVAWLSAPVILTCLVTLFGGVRDALAAKSGSDERKSLMKDLAAVVGIFLAAAAVLGVAPNCDPSPERQTLIFGLELSLTFVALVLHFKRSTKTLKPADLTLVAPTALGLLVPGSATLLTGRALDTPELLPVALVTSALGVWLVLLPYQGALTKVADFVGNVDAYSRVHYFGFTAILVFLGGALARPSPNLLTAAALSVVAMAFHLFAYIHNDVIDLELDRHAKRRSEDPLVMGKVSTHTSLGVCVTAALLAFAGILHLCGFHLTPRNNAFALAALLAAFVLMAAYNVYGKRCRWPIVTDAVQAASWSSLSLSAMLATNFTNPKSDYHSTLPPGSLCLALYAALFILLINGIHGGLRDIVSDARYRRRTTARWLGATPTPEGAARSTMKIGLLSYALLFFMFADLCYFVVSTKKDAFPLHWRYRAVHAALLALFAANAWILWLVVRPHGARRSRWISWSLLFLLVPVMVVFLLANGPPKVFKWTVLCSFVAPLLFQKWIVTYLIRLFHPAAGPREAPAAPASERPAPDPASAAIGMAE